MTDFRASTHAVPIESVDQLVERFHQAGKPRERWMIGTEYEKLAVDADTGAAMPYSGKRGIETLLRELAGRYEWQPTEEEGHVVALERGGANITLEPGGQVELSGAQCPTVHCTRDELQQHVRELVAVGGELGISFLGLGIHPMSTLDEIEWVPKQRYRIMRAYMERVGTLGHRMMKQTATVQANIDYADERDAMRKIHVGMATAPIVNAMFANSSVSEGRLNGQMSFRGHIWTDTDNARCGILPFAFRDDASFADYVQWALDVPMYFILRNGKYVTDVTGVPFRRYLETGHDGRPATVDDWSLHLTTLFPEVRLKGYIEFRSADSQPPERVLALPALVKGVFYEADCLEAARDLVKRWTWEDCVALSQETTRNGLATRWKNVRVQEYARELLAIAEEGLKRHAALDATGQDERIYLERLAEQVESGRSPARAIAEKWDGPWKRDARPLVEFAAFRPS